MAAYGEKPMAIDIHLSRGWVGSGPMCSRRICLIPDSTRSGVEMRSAHA
jgi:hypothetical protein